MYFRASVNSTHILDVLKVMLMQIFSFLARKGASDKISAFTVKSLTWGF